MPPTGRRIGSAPSSRRLFAFDRALASPWLAGADEAGRGCLAGPLVAAAVLFNYRALEREGEGALAVLDDSKRLSPAARERLFGRILSLAEGVGVAVVPAAEIDRRGIQEANLRALREALAAACSRVGEGVPRLVDGFAIPGALAVAGGDRRSAAVAAASVIAKVVRDRHMRMAAALYPQWGFASHVGYPTTAHRLAIARHGLSPLHRRTFRWRPPAQP